MQFHNKRILYISFFLILSFHTRAQDYDGDPETFIIQEIIISGNNKTKQDIILRELLFKTGDNLEPYEIEEFISSSKENLLNTSLFNFVTITYEKNENNSLIINIDLQERWYIWPYPVLEYTEGNLSTFLRNQEWSRTDYGLFVLINNFRGRKEILKLKTIFGYNNRFVLFYSIPFIDKNNKTGIGFDIDYLRNPETAYQINKDELLYIKFQDEFARKTLKLSTFLTYRPYLYSTHMLTLRLSNVSINDTVVSLNPDYLYNSKNDISFLTFMYNFDYDKRDSKYYPLNGIKLKISVVKEGFGLFSEEGTFYFKAFIEDNYKIRNRLYFNTGIESMLSFDKITSYYFSEAIGFNNYIRGMEYYATLGKNYYISKSNLKYEIIPKRMFDLNFISSHKFSKVHYALYFNIFFDTGYVNSDFIINNKLVNDFLYSGGIGIDLVTYYDKVLRIEYSLNKFGEPGFYIHLGAPIINN
ncbi:MAG: hypothetical protein KOO66_07815 [Bacteroidales bacterium]|nr:hypothetical protein [Bacteroidales bacterium]